MTDPQKPNVRIVDIARMAGVSVGTVDRVIHDRGKVSAENLRKVRAVLDKVDYRPNLLARSLASGRSVSICVLIPQFAAGEYWADVNEGVARAAVGMERFNVSVTLFFFDQYDPRSFEQVLHKVRGKRFDGIVIATLFAEQVAAYARELDAEGIPYVFIDSDIAQCNRLAYFGTSSYDAGVLAARLLMGWTDLDADIVLSDVIRAGTSGSNQWRNREAGFRTCLKESGFRGNLHYVSLHIDDEAGNARVLDDLFRAYPGIRGAVTFNSKCYMLGRYLRMRERFDVRLVGYDLIPRNEEMLCAGSVAALIAQRPEAQGYNGVMALYEHLIGVRNIQSVNNMPIDILLKENIRFYKNNNI